MVASWGASGTQDEVVDVVRRRGSPRRAWSLLVNLDVPRWCVGERSCEVVDPDVGVWVERPAVGRRVDRRTHRVEIVAHDEQRAPRSNRVQQVVHTAAVGCAGDRCVLRRNEVERCGLEGTDALASA